MAINRQLRSEIGVETDREYTLLSYEVNAGVEGRRQAALLRAARRRDRRLSLRHVAQPAHEGVHHARAVRPRDAVLRERPAAEPDAARPGDGRPRHRPALRRRPHVLRVGGEPAGVHGRDRGVRRRRDRGGASTRPSTRSRVASAPAGAKSPRSAPRARRGRSGRA